MARPTIIVDKLVSGEAVLLQVARGSQVEQTKNLYPADPERFANFVELFLVVQVLEAD